MVEVAVVSAGGVEDAVVSVGGVESAVVAVSVVSIGGAGDGGACELCFLVR